MIDYDEQIYMEDYPDQSCQVHDDNGVIHYFDEEGEEVDTFIPEWGC